MIPTRFYGMVREKLASRRVVARIRSRVVVGCRTGVRTCGASKLTQGYNNKHHRRYARLDSRLHVVIEGQKFQAINWSLGGIAVDHSSKFRTIGDILSGELNINSEGIEVTIAVKLRIAYKQVDRVGLSFLGLLPNQIGVLRALILKLGVTPLEEVPDAVSAGALAVPQLHDPRTARPLASARRLGMMLLWLIPIAFIPGFLYAKPELTQGSNRSVYGALARPAERIVAADRGYVDRVLVGAGSQLDVGQQVLMFRLRAEPNTLASVSSPCVCTVIATVVKSGAEIEPGSTVAYVSATSSSDFVVEALFPSTDGLTPGRPVEVLPDDGNPALAGVIEQVDAAKRPTGLFGLPEFLRNDERYVYALIRLSSENKKLAAGAPVSVTLASSTR